MSNFVNMTESSIYCIIVAAGSGSRFGSELPKQFCELNGKPVLMHTIAGIRNGCPDVKIVLVLNRKHQDLWQDLCSRHNFMSPDVRFGGATRWESVKNALSDINLPHNRKSIVMVHDGARPIVKPELLHRIIEAAADATGVIPVIPVSDSLRMISDDGRSVPVDRGLFRAVQTPQAFDGQLLLDAYKLPYRDTFTDDASVMAAASYPDIKLVDGDPCNIKITLPYDLKIASLYLDR